MPNGIKLLGEDDDVAIFMDWLSLPQKPRTVAEDKIFKKALKQMGSLYSSTNATAVVQLVTASPPLPRPYHCRGWCCFEEHAAKLCKHHFSDSFWLKPRQLPKLMDISFGRSLDAVARTLVPPNAFRSRLTKALRSWSASILYNLFLYIAVLSFLSVAPLITAVAKGWNTLATLVSICKYSPAFVLPILLLLYMCPALVGSYRQMERNMKDRIN